MEVIQELQGKVFKSVKRVEDSIEFEEIGGKVWVMEHRRDCCEYVNLEDICGDLKDLEGEVLEMAEMVTNRDIPAKNKYSDSYTWTFYKFATGKGYVTLRWYGESNGYYSEGVDIYERY